MLTSVVLITLGILVVLCKGSILTVVGLAGGDVTLPCEYDVSTYGLLNVCWGRDQSWFNCDQTLIATDGLMVNHRQSSRYSLSTKLQHGDVSLTIIKAQKADTGFYVCRIEIPGLFNDLSYGVYLIITNVCPCRSINVTGFIGQNVTLHCRYDFKYHGKCVICWMRGDIPNFGCGNEIIASDGDKVVKKTSHRYQLDGELQKGDASLTIYNTRLQDSGRYGCRVHVPGWFNDEKNIVDLVILKGKKKTRRGRRRESLDIDQNSNISAIYSNSEVSIGLYNRSMAVENIYQLDTENEYEQWSR
ncbi:T-cell immunoglobulin and mucin domain-containing protein 4 [Bagarius yarrelli]|nr:T-cell immunoglobulin and mucin domain-containing protein 4 [Bagarius yarrelli]